MPPTLNYPGVYIDEISNGVHTITGVATSIAAFVGWAPKGPTNQAVLVLSFSDFQRQFGGLDTRSYLGYAVNQFFANGGQQAYIVRIAWDGSLTAAAGTTAPKSSAVAKGTVGSTLKLWAGNPGAWGNKLAVGITTQAADNSRFQLQVYQGTDSTGPVLESYVNLSTNPLDEHYVVNVVNNDSVNITFVDPSNPNAKISISGQPTNGVVALTGGDDGDALNPSDGVNGDGNFEIALGVNPRATSFGVPLLDRVDIFNLLCVPGETDADTIGYLQRYCQEKRAFYIVDCPQSATISQLNSKGPFGLSQGSPASLSASAQEATYSAYYFPWIQASDPQIGNRLRLFPPSGFVAGVYASTDSGPGVWKAPAGISATLAGASALQSVLTDSENGQINVKAVNCLRQFKVYGNVVWGARTLAGNDQVGSQWKYVPIRRFALFLESSLYNGTQWVVFEPNDEALWSSIRLNVGAFLHGLFLQGAFQGTTPQQAYFVKCDSENNPQASIDLGIVNILVGFAPLYPAEFVVIQIQQMAGQIQT